MEAIKVNFLYQMMTIGQKYPKMLEKFVPFFEEQKKEESLSNLVGAIMNVIEGRRYVSCSLKCPSQWLRCGMFTSHTVNLCSILSQGDTK